MSSLFFGLFGLPRLGILGAGIGTALSRLIGVVLLFQSYKKRHTVCKAQLLVGIGTFLRLKSSESPSDNGRTPDDATW